MFTGAIVEHTAIKSSFTAFADTSIYERYMLNAVQFSSAKSVAKAGLMQAAVFDEDKAVKSFSQFAKDAEQITEIVDRTWLRTEYDTGVKQAVGAELFSQMRADADLYGYWEYLETTSANPREDHLALVGLVFRIGDPDGDACFPQNGFNCGCGSSTLDDNELQERGLRVLSNDEAKVYLNKDIDPQFRFNAADQGIMPKEGHSYFQALPNANKADYKMFDLPAADKLGGDKDLTGLAANPSRSVLAAKGLHNLLNIMHEWQHNYHTDKLGNIIFQNKATMANVKFTNNSLHQIQKHGRGFENIPDVIAGPDEIWGRWANANEQLAVERVYIKFGKVSYLVKTTDGVITDAFAVSNTAANGFRKGVIL